MGLKIYKKFGLLGSGGLDFNIGNTACIRQIKRLSALLRVAYFFSLINLCIHMLSLAGHNFPYSFGTHHISYHI